MNTFKNKWATTLDYRIFTTRPGVLAQLRFDSPSEEPAYIYRKMKPKLVPQPRVKGKYSGKPCPAMENTKRR